MVLYQYVYAPPELRLNTWIKRLTVVRTQGMRLMRPEKSWRPIITVEVDKHQAHETVLGTDGQNPNLKETLHLYALVNFISSGTLLY